MSTAEKNLFYFTLERRGLFAISIAAFALWFSFFAAWVNIHSPVFTGLWVIHIAAHLSAVILSVYLLVSFLSRLPAKRRLFYLAIFSLVCLLPLVLAALPITSRDALMYHLAVPKWWNEGGSIQEYSWHEWSHFPLLLSLSYAGFLQFGLEQLTPYFHYSYLLLLAATTAAFVYYKFQDEEYALIAAFFCLSLPVAMRVGIEPMSDLALAFYFGIAYALFIFWGEQRGRGSLRILVGCFLGFALCTKYNAILATCLFGLCAISFLQRWNLRLGEAIRSLGIVFLVALLIFSPWPYKNFLYTSNPLYPFAGGIFGVSDEVPFTAGVSPIAYRLIGYEERWWELFLIPLRMMFFGQDGVPKQFDGLLSPILLLGLFAFRRRPEEARVPPWIVNTALLIVSYFILSLNLFYALLRYQAPLFVPMMVLALAGCSRLTATRGAQTRSRILTVFCVSQLLFSLWYQVGWWNALQPGAYLFGTQTKKEFLREKLDEFSTTEYVNAHLPEEAKIYLLFTGNRFYYYDRRVQGAYFSQVPIAELLSASGDTEGFFELVRNMGITHFAIHSRRTKDSFERTLNPREKQLWSDFVSRHMLLLEQIGGQSVWAVK